MSIERIPSLLERTINRFDVFLTSLVEPTSSPARRETRPVGQPVGTTGSSKQAPKQVDWLMLGLELTWSLLITTASGCVLLYLSRRLSSLMSDDPNAAPRNVVCGRLQKILEKRQNYATIPHLTTYELQMAEEVLDPDDIEISFADIGGLDCTKQEIYELAVLPLLQPELFAGKLVQPTKGILLFGKPGTGKTMLAKALAKEAQAVFLPLQLSKILSKWVGESNKLVAATFSLAQKLQPAIIFIDELDTFLKANNTETAYLDSIKAEFLTLWDGVGTSQFSRIMVLGATNKPHLIDSAILRRMPRAFQVPLPDVAGRKAILELLLHDEIMEPTARDFVPTLAEVTAGYSGSDLKELCKAAAMVRVQELTAEFSRRRVMGEKVDPSSHENFKALRPISKEDLVKGCQKVKRTGAVAMSYGKEEAAEEQRQQIDKTSLRSFLALMRSLSQLSVEEKLEDIPDLGN